MHAYRIAYAKEIVNPDRGYLWDLAIGDALGASLEFCRPGTFPPITDLVGGGRFGLQSGDLCPVAVMSRRPLNILGSATGWPCGMSIQSFLLPQRVCK